MSLIHDISRRGEAAYTDVISYGRSSYSEAREELGFLIEQMKEHYNKHFDYNGPYTISSEYFNVLSDLFLYKAFCAANLKLHKECAELALLSIKFSTNPEGWKIEDVFRLILKHGDKPIMTDELEKISSISVKQKENYLIDHVLKINFTR
jgi:hypothetical protein